MEGGRKGQRERGGVKGRVKGREGGRVKWREGGREGGLCVKLNHRRHLTISQLFNLSISYLRRYDHFYC